MEAKIAREKRLDILSPGGLLEVASACDQFADACVGRVLDCQFHCQHFKLGSDTEDLADFGASQSCDHATLVRLSNHQPLMFERDQRLPHGGLSDAKLPGHARFHNPLARVQLSRDDHTADRIRYLIGKESSAS